MFSQILQSHLQRYPGIQIQDIYKLIHQAALGNAHAVPDPQAAWRHLQQEISELRDGPPEPLRDPISPDGRIVRIHLRPYLADGGDPDALCAAFLASAQQIQGDTTRLEEFWRSAMMIAPHFRDPMGSYIASLRAKNYPPVHHSSKFRLLYQPAYRVILGNLL